MFGFNADKFLNKHCTKIVRIGEKYAIRRRHWFKYPFSLYEDEFVDLESLLKQHERDHVDNVSSEGGFMLALSAPRVQWWKHARAVKVYCVSSDLEKVLQALEILKMYVEPPEPALPTVEVVDNIKMELAQFKLKK